jgi:hypothetical protein
MDLLRRYPEDPYGSLADACWNTQALFNWGRDKERRWTNAEEFVEFVDGASAGSESADTLNRICNWAQVTNSAGGTRSINFAKSGGVQTSVTRALVAECASFWKDARIDTERWAPYRGWQIIDANRCNVVLPGQPRDPKGHDRRTRLLKLHGSVTWRVDADQCRYVEIEEALRQTQVNYAMAVPGPSKWDTAKRLFEPLWKEAEDAIRQADAIVFLGYRFPETDSEARRRILTAIANNQSARRLRIHVVLGADLGHRDVVRMRRLVEVCVGPNRTQVRTQSEDEDARDSHIGRLAQIIVEPLYAEDFLALYGNGGPLFQSKW